MKLSEAIRLGSMLGPQRNVLYDPNTEGSCALGAAQLAMGVKEENRAMSRTFWPWLVSTVNKCPVCSHASNFGCIVHLNDTHRWTREQIADYIATIEPQQEARVESGEMVVV